MIKRYGVNGGCYPADHGLVVYYADAEKWVGEEVAERDRTISRLRNDLCDRRISLGAALKLCKGKDEEIATLTAENGVLREQIAALKTEIEAWHEVFGTTQLSHASESFRKLQEFEVKMEEGK